jgi:hypothetical protein
MNWEEYGINKSYSLQGVLSRHKVKVKVKVKLSLCLTKHHAMAYWGMDVQLHAFFTSAL